MRAPDTDTRLRFNDLRRGAIYRATTPGGAAVGEYLGMEAPYGDWALLLRHQSGTESIALARVISIHPLAA